MKASQIFTPEDALLIKTALEIFSPPPGTKAEIKSVVNTQTGQILVGSLTRWT